MSKQVLAIAESVANVGVVMTICPHQEQAVVLSRSGRLISCHCFAEHILSGRQDDCGCFQLNSANPQKGCPFERQGKLACNQS